MGGRKSLEWSQGQSLGGGLVAKPPEDRYRHIQTVCSCQMLFYAGLLPSPSSVFPSSLTPKKTFDMHESHDPTQPGQGRHVPTRGYATGHTCELKPLDGMRCHLVGRHTRVVPSNIVLDRSLSPPWKGESRGSEPPVKCRQTITVRGMITIHSL